MPRLSFQNNAIHGAVGLPPTVKFFFYEKTLLATLSKFSPYFMQYFPSEDLKHLIQFTLVGLKIHVVFAIIVAGGSLFLTGQGVLCFN